MSSEIVVAIQLDAFRHDYITNNDSPFLSLLRKRGIAGSLIPPFGFEPDAAYFAGLYPEECDGGAHYWYSPDTSPFKFTRFWSRCLEWLPELPERVVRRAIGWATSLNSKYSLIRCYASTARIPLSLLAYFDFPMKQLPYEKDFISGKKTVFNILSERERAWFFHGSPTQRVNSESVRRRVRSELKPPATFAFLHISDLDGTGHNYGPNSIERKEVLKQVDAQIAAIYEIVKGRFDNVHLLIFGDHGMAEVSEKINIWSRLKKLDSLIGKDYVFFLDSTMARFWFFNERAKEQIVGLLQEFKQGHILTKEERIGYRINYSHNKFGDLIFLVDPGMLIFPNFFQKRRPAKGMHGYSSEFKDQQSAFLIDSTRVKNGKIFEEAVDMRLLFPTILDLLDIAPPKTSDTISLLRN